MNPPPCSKTVICCWLISRPRLLASRPHACSSSVLDACLKWRNTCHTCVIPCHQQIALYYRTPFCLHVSTNTLLVTLRGEGSLYLSTKRLLLPSWGEAFIYPCIHNASTLRVCSSSNIPESHIIISSIIEKAIHSLSEEENYLYTMACIITRR